MNLSTFAMKSGLSVRLRNCFRNGRTFANMVNISWENAALRKAFSLKVSSSTRDVAMPQYVGTCLSQRLSLVPCANSIFK